MRDAVIRSGLFVVLATACAPIYEDSAPPTGESASTTSPSYGSTTAPYGTTESDEGGDDAYEEDDGGTGCAFTCPPPPGGGGGGGGFNCDPWAQDCGLGQKCAPWSNDGGGSWNATRCVPVDTDPVGYGEECTVVGSGVSGNDDCAFGLLCWNVDPTTNTGTCIALCTGSEGSPSCADPTTTCVVANEGVLILCLPACDPLVQDCGEGLACYPFDDQFVCTPDSSGELGAFGDACEFINVCDPGLFCANPDLVPDCVGATGCCSTFCDLTLPADCPGDEQECVPWTDGEPMIGACIIPP